ARERPLLPVKLIARRFHIGEEVIALFQNFGDQRSGRSAADGTQQTFLRLWIPKAIQGVTKLAAGNVDADMPRSDVLHGVPFIKDDKVVFEKNASFKVAGDSAKHREEKCVVQHQHIGSENFLPRALEEADSMIFGEVRAVAALV